MRLRGSVVALPLVLPFLVVAAACAPQDSSPSASDSNSGSPASCAKADLPLIKPGTLTIGTDSPAYDPWFSNNDPTNGKGYESAVAYAVADQLGFSRDEVTWVKVPFNSSYKPGAKNFDFDINQISITPARAKVVDFSDGYYAAAQAVIALKGSKASEATSLADLKDLKLGAQTGTTSLTAIRDVIQPSQDPAVFEDTNAAKQALLNHQVDAILADLPTAFYISAVEIPNSTIVGQFQPETGQQEEFGMLFQKGSGLVPCVNEALATLKSDGTLADLEKKWLSDVVNVPTLQ
ncbi:ABC transporter substrate-binding protein [Nocardioides ungokensis]|nr:ABC transporter substrate-binding protein [Nocardioides ungokensis]